MHKNIPLIVLFLILINPMQAQQDDARPVKKVPSLYGHTFPTLSKFRSSFVNTSLQAELGFGNTSPLKIPGMTIGDYEVFAFEGQIVYFDMKVRYQQRFTPWLALHLSFSTAGRTGSDMSTILADGVNTLSGGAIGWLIRIRQTERFNLSTSLTLNNLTGSFINVTEYFRDVVNNVPDPSVTKKVPATNLSAGISGAYAFSPTFGLQFQGEYAYGESFVRDKTDGYFAIGAAGDVDFNPRYNVPVGLALGYTLTSAPEIVLSDGGNSNIVTAQAGYTGSNEFELGLQYTYYNVEIMSVDEKPFVSKVMLVLKFYF
jgi:hypothetical protein